LYQEPRVDVGGGGGRGKGGEEARHCGLGELNMTNKTTNHLP